MERRYEIRGPRIEGVGIVAIVVIIIVGGVIIFSVGRVGVGEVAVVVDPVMGSTTSVGDGANARYFFKAPWASVFKVYVATDSVNMWTDATGIGDFPAVPSLTMDGLRVDVDITVRWRILPSAVVELFRRFPLQDWRDRAIIPIIREAIRNLIAEFTAIETIERRGTIAVALEEDLIGAFGTEPSLAGAIILDAVDLRRITLPDNFVDAIESKLAAEQLSIAAEFNKTRILILANATAQSRIIASEGQARSRIILANATRDAIDAIIHNNPDVSMDDITQLYLYLETLRDISESGNSQFIVITGDQGQFIVPIP